MSSLALMLAGMLVSGVAPIESETGPGEATGFRKHSESSLRIASGICPQKRKTRQAPSGIRKKSNPLPRTAENLDQGKALYFQEARPTACAQCHGIRGNGNGRLARNLEPPPRNFTCSDTMNSISDGQMFWIIKNGSRGTAMPEHISTLSDREIWQLIHFIRAFTR